MRMLWAGLGDMVAKYIAICEWRISNIVTGEYYCEHIAQLMRTAVKKIVDASDGITKRDPDAIQSIAEGLIIAGVGMAYAEISRPASGLEHYFSHMWEMMALERGKPYDLHGIQVGIGTVLSMKLYKYIREIKPDRAVAEAHMKAFNRADWEAQIRRIFGKTANEIIAIEDKCHKNDPQKHAKRLDNILNHWDEIHEDHRRRAAGLRPPLQSDGGDWYAHEAQRYRCSDCRTSSTRSSAAAIFVTSICPVRCCGISV